MAEPLQFLNSHPALPHNGRANLGLEWGNRLPTSSGRLQRLHRYRERRLDKKGKTASLPSSASTVDHALSSPSPSHPCFLCNQDSKVPLMACSGRGQMKIALTERVVLRQQSGCLSTRDPPRYSTPSSLLNSNHRFLLSIYGGLKMCLYYWLADVCLTDTKIKPGTQYTQQIKKISLKLEASEGRFWEWRCRLPILGTLPEPTQ